MSVVPPVLTITFSCIGSLVLHQRARKVHHTAQLSFVRGANVNARSGFVVQDRVAQSGLVALFPSLYNQKKGTIGRELSLSDLKVLGLYFSSLHDTPIDIRAYVHANNTSIVIRLDMEKLSPEERMKVAHRCELMMGRPGDNHHSAIRFADPPKSLDITSKHYLWVIQSVRIKVEKIAFVTSDFLSYSIEQIDERIRQNEEQARQTKKQLEDEWAEWDAKLTCPDQKPKGIVSSAISYLTQRVRREIETFSDLIDLAIRVCQVVLERAKKLNPTDRHQAVTVVGSYLDTFKRYRKSKDEQSYVDFESKINACTEALIGLKRWVKKTVKSCNKEWTGAWTCADVHRFHQLMRHENHCRNLVGNVVYGYLRDMNDSDDPRLSRHAKEMAAKLFEEST